MFVIKLTLFSHIYIKISKPKPMKNPLTTLTILLLATLFAGAQNEISFGYDGAGNRLSRSIVPLEKIVEWGQVNVSQESSSDWTIVDLDNTYQDAVVFMGPLSYNGGNPSTIRVKDVGTNAFKFQIDEWDYLDGAHTNEYISYMVIESGRHFIGDLEVRAGILNKVNHESEYVRFPRDFPSRDAVYFTQVSTYNGSDAVVTRTRARREGFEVWLQEEEGNNNLHVEEKVSYIAIERGTDIIDGKRIEVGKKRYALSEDWDKMNFNSDFRDTPLFLANMQSVNGSDPVGMRYKNLTENSVEVKAEEEQSADDEIHHANEDVGYLVLESAGKESKETSFSSDENENKKDSSQVRHEDEQFRERSIHVYPNPTNGKLAVEFAGYENTRDIHIQVYNMQGQLIQTINQPDMTNQIDISGHAAGTYLIRVITGEKTKEYKVIKK